MLALDMVVKIGLGVWGCVFLVLVVVIIGGRIRRAHREFRERVARLMEKQLRQHDFEPVGVRSIGTAVGGGPLLAGVLLGPAGLVGALVGALAMDDGSIFRVTFTDTDGREHQAKATLRVGADGGIGLLWEPELSRIYSASRADAMAHTLEGMVVQEDAADALERMADE